MARPKTIHVAPNGSGSWVVRTEPGSRGQVFSTQTEAMKAAQRTASHSGAVLHVHNAKGQQKTSFTLGRAAMAKINAVEGVALTPAGKQAFQDFDRGGLTPSQRRAALRKKAATLGGTSPSRSTVKG